MGNILGELQVKFLTRNLHKLTPDQAYDKGHYYYIHYDKGAATALVFYEYAAKHGHVWAMDQCGEMYSDGDGCKKDLRKALYWYRRCLEGLLATPQVNGGLSAVAMMECIEATIASLPADIREWEYTFTEADWAAAHARDNGGASAPAPQPTTTHRKPTPQPAPAPKPAPAKTAEELFYEGVRYCDANDYVKALHLFEQVAQQGYPDAQYNCGIMYQHGQGYAIDMKKALYWYEKAAHQGHAEAQNNCGSLYINGEGCTQDFKKAMYWFEKSAQQGNAKAQNNCGFMYDYGKGYTMDKKKALYWYEKSAQQDVKEAQFNCGIMYSKGEGCTKNMQKAKYWLQKAADQGHQRAKERLAKLNS